MKPKKQRITWGSPGTTLAGPARVPFDMVTHADGVSECWIRYKGGRIFLKKEKSDKPWRAFRFETKSGTTWDL